jgi:hypothetical protein
VRVYGRVLTPAEIASLAQGKLLTSLVELSCPVARATWKCPAGLERAVGGAGGRAPCRQGTCWS